jgi:SAM-dependent methyltransferase
MGLGASTVEAIVREHSHKPIQGNVLTIGRQTIYLSPQQYVGILREHGVTPTKDQLEKTTIDRQTISRRTIGNTAEKDLISDRSLFHMLGVTDVRALDHSDYEGAEVLHDLNEPLPTRLESIADFIVDGSTIDNVFDPASALRNLAKLLRPGGRMLLLNALSNHHEAYTIPSALWYLNYFVMNGFADCKVYIVLHYPTGTNVFCIDPNCLLDSKLRVLNFVSPHEMACVVFAEKGPNSTTDVCPSQGHYRSKADWRTYRQQLAAIKSNPRPHILRSSEDMSFFEVQAGHLFVAADYSVRDPSTEQRRLQAARGAAPLIVHEGTQSSRTN